MDTAHVPNPVSEAESISQKLLTLQARWNSNSSTQPLNLHFPSKTFSLWSLENLLTFNICKTFEAKFDFNLLHIPGSHSCEASCTAAITTHFCSVKYCCPLEKRMILCLHYWFRLWVWPKTVKLHVPVVCKKCRKYVRHCCIYLP